ncbi:MAG: twin-arginine translocase subunit TatC [Alistipes sp.]|nr:twin-arginine translocase subunit TatC [Alistipes sp.]MBO5399455.1 twin-arginine translocase subunit TatC [Alistipes sp.]MBP3600913.1 twin-arginine translocase subunit TatC [Alistipes sp.]
MSNQPTHDEAEMTFGEHLDEVRKILVRVAITFTLLFIVLFSMKGIVLDIVFAPIRETFPTNQFFAWLAKVLGTEALDINPENVELFNNKMAGQFLLHIKSSVVGAFIIAFPYLIWELWLFVKPALPPHQRKRSIRYVLETPIWFVMGLLFGYYIISPLAINFLGNYQVSDQISNIIDVSSFMTTVISVSFAAAVAFQLPLLIRLLATMGIVSSDGMRQYRKVAAVALLVFAAIITPPDVISQCLIFVPCYVLYEYGIGIAERIEKRRAKDEAEYQAKVEAEKAAAREREEQEAKQKAEKEAQEKAAEEARQKKEAEQKSEAEKEAEQKGEQEAAQSDNDDNEPTPTEPEKPAEEPADETEETKSEAKAEKSAPKSGEQTDENPDNPNPGDYLVEEEHEMSFGVSESTDEELEIMRRFMPKSEE